MPYLAFQAFCVLLFLVLIPGLVRRIVVNRTPPFVEFPMGHDGVVRTLSWPKGKPLPFFSIPRVYSLMCLVLYCGLISVYAPNLYRAVRGLLSPE